MSKPLISAIIPTYQRPDVVQRAVRSVLAQDWRPLELIVVDDGSGDETQAVLQALGEEAEKADVAFKSLEVPNGGAGKARTKGMEEASGEYLAFLDDDDAWAPQKISNQLAAMQTTPEAGVSFTQYVHEGSPDVPKPKPEFMHDGWVFDTLCSGATRAHQQTLMIQRQVFEKLGGFADYFNFQDFEYCLRASLEFQFLAVHEPLTVIHTLESSISRGAGLEGDLKRDRLKLRVLGEFRDTYRAHKRYVDESMRKAFARIYDEHVKHLLWLGRTKEARAAWKEAVQECGDQPLLNKLKSKLKRARVAGWFGVKLRKPN